MTTTFDNVTDADLADEIGRLDFEAKALAKRLAAAKDEFKRRGLDHAEGSEFAVKATTAARWSLDSKAIKTAMGDEWAQRFSKIANVTSLRVSPAMATA